MVEVIGEYGQQIKPILDVDVYDNDMNINDVIKDINKKIPNKSAINAKREARETKNGIKYSDFIFKMFEFLIKI